MNEKKLMKNSNKRFAIYMAKGSFEIVRFRTTRRRAMLTRYLFRFMMFYLNGRNGIIMILEARKKGGE